MKIIRDEETFGLMMIPLFHEWGIKRCNVSGCTNKPSTIISELSPDVPVSGWCEDHFQDFKTSGRFKGTLDFDNFDAFAHAVELGVDK